MVMLFQLELKKLCNMLAVFCAVAMATKKTIGRTPCRPTPTIASTGLSAKPEPLDGRDLCRRTSAVRDFLHRKGRMTWKLVLLYRVLLVLGLFAQGSAFAKKEDPFRIFTTIDGQCFEGRISAHAQDGTRVQIERPDGRKTWIQSNVLCEKDQMHVADCRAVELFLLSMSLDSSLRKITEPIPDSKDLNVVYEMELVNRTDVPFIGVWVDYRIYIEEEGVSGNKDSERCVGGQIELGTLPAGKKVICRSEPERLVKQGPVVERLEHDIDENRTYINSIIATKHIDQPRGAWFRLCMKTSEGNVVARDVSTPVDLGKRVAWVERPKRAGHRRSGGKAE